MNFTELELTEESLNKLHKGGYYYPGYCDSVDGMSYHITRFDWYNPQTGTCTFIPIFEGTYYLTCDAIMLDSNDVRSYVFKPHVQRVITADDVQKTRDKIDDVHDKCIVFIERQSKKNQLCSS